MKAELNITTLSIAAYRAIKPALVAADFCYLGVSGLTIFAIIDYRDYPYLVDLVANAAKQAHIPHEEYAIVTIKNIPDYDSKTPT